MMNIPEWVKVAFDGIGAGAFLGIFGAIWRGWTRARKAPELLADASLAQRAEKASPTFVNTVAPVFNVPIVHAPPNAHPIGARIDEEEYEVYRNVLPALSQLESALTYWRAGTHHPPVDEQAVSEMQAAYEAYVGPMQTWQSIIEHGVQNAHWRLIQRLGDEASDRALVGTKSYDAAEATRCKNEVTNAIGDLRRAIERRIATFRAAGSDTAPVPPSAGTLPPSGIHPSLPTPASTARNQTQEDETSIYQRIMPALAALESDLERWRRQPIVARRAPSQVLMTPETEAVRRSFETYREQFRTWSPFCSAKVKEALEHVLVAINAESHEWFGFVSGATDTGAARVHERAVATAEAFHEARNAISSRVDLLRRGERD
jgi:hypothetical protein